MANIQNFKNDYNATYWLNGGDHDYATPLSAENLNKLDSQIDGLTAQIVNITNNIIPNALSSMGSSESDYGAYNYVDDNNQKSSIHSKFVAIEEQLSSDDASLAAHLEERNPHSISKSMIGLGNVDNTADSDKELNEKQANAVKQLISEATLTPEQVGLGNVLNVGINDQKPTYVDVSTLTELNSGESLSAALGKLAKAVVDLIDHVNKTSNPHSVTKSQLGLNKVDNTADIDKPISKAVQQALDNLGKSGAESSGNCAAHIANKNNPHETTKTHIGLSNVDNTSDADKPVSTLQAAAIADAKAAGTKAQAAIDAHKKDTNNPHTVTLAQLGVTVSADKLNLCSNVTSDVQDQINAKANQNDIATTKYLGSSVSTTSMYKISGLGSFSVDSDGDKNIQLLISSRGGETVWCSLVSDGKAKAIRLFDYVTCISELKYSLEEDALYVTAQPYCHGVHVHVINNTNGIFVPVIESINSLPANLVNITITSFGIKDESTQMGDSSRTLSLIGSALRPRYNGGELMLVKDMPNTEEWTFTLEDGSTVTKAVLVK